MGLCVCSLSAPGPAANESKEMISNTYYSLNKAEDRVLSTAEPEAKPNLAPLTLPETEYLKFSPKL